MANQTQSQLAPYIERARKVLQYEQRGNHQDRVVHGGLELFVVRWADEVSAACKSAGLDVRPLYRFTEHLEGYRRQDPMQRAASLRAALAILSEFEDTTNDGDTHRGKREETKQPDEPGQPQKAIQSDVLERPHQPGRPQEAAQPDEPGRPRGSPVPYTDNDAVYGTGDPRGRPALPAANPHPIGDDTRSKANVNARTRGARAQVPDRAATSPGKSEARERPPVHLDAGMTTNHASLALLSADVTVVPGVGPSVAARLRSLGIRTVRDLLFYFPRQHRDYSKLEKIANIPFEQVATTLGLIWEVETTRTSGGRTRTIATISDESGKLRVSWFNQPYLQKQLQAAKGEYIVVTGTKRRFGNKVEFNVQSYELPERGDLLSTGRLVPIYSLTEGLHAKTLRRFTKWVVDRYASMIPEHLPAGLRAAAKLLPLPEAVVADTLSRKRGNVAGRAPPPGFR